ncbi:MAG: hypothetical protein F6J95_026770 [Leptolyngbya sp. SIO1E4]|nr:hypothetical protein [Leptolyngbya sp. SIO1E4]
MKFIDSYFQKIYEIKSKRQGVLVNLLLPLLLGVLIVQMNYLASSSPAHVDNIPIISILNHSEELEGLNTKDRSIILFNRIGINAYLFLTATLPLELAYEASKNRKVKMGMLNLFGKVSATLSPCLLSSWISYFTSSVIISVISSPIVHQYFFGIGPIAKILFGNFLIAFSTLYISFAVFKCKKKLVEKLKLFLIFSWIIYGFLTVVK